MQFNYNLNTVSAFKLTQESLTNSSVKLPFTMIFLKYLLLFKYFFFGSYPEVDLDGLAA